MPDRHVFEYAVIRVVPRMEREEFLNVGVVLFCKSRRYLDCRYLVDQEKLAAVFPQLDLEDVEAHLQSFERICRAAKEGGPIALLDTPSRFRWLTATRSTVVQAGKVHTGLCEELPASLDKLYAQLVL